MSSPYDTTLLGGTSRFPVTCWEDLCRAGDPRADGALEAANALASTYWRPVYHYIRTRWSKSNEDAKDLTQEFFTEIFDPEFLARWDRSRGTFRSFVLSSLRNFLVNEERDRHRQKRGGGTPILSLDFRDADSDRALDPPSGEETPESAFDRRWAQSLLDQTLAELERRLTASGHTANFEAFRLYCLQSDGETTYERIARDLGLSTKEVDNAIYTTRREFRQLLTEILRSTLSDPAQLGDELKSLFGNWK